MTYMPKRVQRKRGKGWRTPICGCGCGKPARYVGRPARWGNPARVKQFSDGEAMVTAGIDTIGLFFSTPEAAYAEAVRQYRWWIEQPQQWALKRLAHDLLKGHDLMCWCPQEHPCHADVLLEIANQETKQ